MARVRLEKVGKQFGDVEVVKEMDLEIKDREFLVLVGPSGCGKNTTLRMIAGLEDVSSGNIYIDDTVVNDVHPKDRDIAMVFQSYALYPHMSVEENLAFGLKLRRHSKKIIGERLKEAAEILGLDKLLHRKPKELSGGQRQRVALGRAIVRNPKVFLMDEPLSNLDAKLRVQMRAELKKLHRRLQTTVIYVTHDQVEAMTLGERIVVMHSGEIKQAASPIEIYKHPANRFVAGFIGTPPMNFIEGALRRHNGEIHFSTEFLSLPIPKEVQAQVEPHLGKPVTLGLRPEDIYDKRSGNNGNGNTASFLSEVDFRELMGSETYLFVKIGKHSLVSKVDALNDAIPGTKLEMLVNLSKLHLFQKESEEAIL